MDALRLELQSVIIPDQKVAEGVLIKSASRLWARIVEVLHRDWSRAYEIPPRAWEEIVAGAFSCQEAPVPPVTQRNCSSASGPIGNYPGGSLLL
jgi:hypothetical protein